MSRLGGVSGRPARTATICMSTLRVYEECTLRCQNCQRAFQAVMIPSPPVVDSDKDAYFCCWGFFPLGYSGNAKDTSGSHNWMPFSPMFTCPSQPHRNDRNVPDGNWNVPENRSVFGPKKANVNVNVKVRKPKAIIIDDDDDVLMEVSDPSEDSDDEWDSSRKKKKAKSVKGKGSAIKTAKKAQGEKVKKGNQNVAGQVQVGSGENLQGGSEMQEGIGVTNASIGETSKKGVASNSKKQTGKNTKELGKLDLNVEFSNEVEEPAPGMSEGNGTGKGEEDNIEGIAFFEGLDEFLSSLPILSVVGDDKVKAA
ncbi:hypothetical protein L1049_000012 [Liquidambar formosana]|uniref:Uncharacterized protein n=1 Tax=Liquidambar formosana TaxID=63359 RepID=A0AAP0N6T0_LIQFO